MSGDIIVNLLGGTYQLASTWSFAPADSGTNGFSVIWRAAPNTTPIISGGRIITGWTDSAGRPGIVQANVGAAFNTRQLYANGVRLSRAGGPVPVTLTQPTPDIGGYTASDTRMAGWSNPSNIEFEYSGASHHFSANYAWTDSRCPIGRITGATIVMAQPCWGNLTREAGIPWFTPGCGQTPCTPTRLTRIPSRVENALELLDEADEWYLDRPAGALYYKPPTTAGMPPMQAAMSSTIVAPVLETLLDVAGSLAAPVHHLQFANLTFAYATWLRPANPAGFAEMQANFTQTAPEADGKQGACDTPGPNGAPLGGSCPFGSWTKTPANVMLRAAQNVTFTNDTFTHLGGVGLSFEFGSSADAVSGCTFTDISGSGIQIGGTDDPAPTDSRATVSNVRITGNYIHDLPVEYLGGVGIFVGYTKDVAIQNNQISNTPYSGMTIGWGGWARNVSSPDPASLRNASSNNVVSNNHVMNVLQSLSDGGALYSNGNRGMTLATGDRYVGNHFHHVLHGGNALYDDIGSRFIAIEKQVVYHTPSSWGGCGAFSEITFQNGFRAPSFLNFVCNPTGSPTESNSVSLVTADPAVECESLPACASIIAAAGPRAADAERFDARGEAVLVDDQDPSIIYEGAWTSDPHRPFSDIESTLHYAMANGSAFRFDFVGSAIDYLAELDSNRGAVNVTVDGVPFPQAMCWAQGLIVNQPCARIRGLAPGKHTLRVSKLGATFISLDGLRVYTGGAQGRSVDDVDAAISYSGGSWATFNRSVFAEYQSTLHAATANGDGYTVAFTGMGFDLIGDRDSSRGAFDVSIDGGVSERVSVGTASDLSSRQLLYGARALTQGAHTVTVTKRTGAFLDLDRVDLFGVVIVNDDSSSVVYSGSSWVDFNGRQLGDSNDDVHQTTHDGDNADLAFTGSGVDVITENGPDRGVIDVRVDGVPRERIFAYAPTFASKQTVYRLRGLARGPHHIVLTKRGQAVMAIDAFNVYE